MLPLVKKTRKPFAKEGTLTNILFIHGYSGSPYDLRLLANFLHKKNYGVKSFFLLGHETDVDQLQNINFNDWIKQVNAQIKELKGDKIILVGLSLGALLSIICSIRKVKIGAIILISPALSFKTSAKAALIAMKLGLLPKSFNLPKIEGKSDIKNERAQKLSPSFSSLPLKGLLDLEQLIIKCEDTIKKLKIPIFAAFGKEDRSIDVLGSIKKLKEAKNIDIKIYENSGHIVSIDNDSKKLALDIYDFLQKNGF